MNSASRYVHRNFITKYNELTRSDVFYSSSTSRKPKKGDPSSLNIAALPIIKREVKNRLSRKEVCSLQDYDLETYITELALIDYSYFKATSIEELMAGIIAFMRKETKFWILDSEVYNAIKETGEFKPEDPQNGNGNSDSLEDDRSIPYSVLREHIEKSSSETLFAANRYMRIPRLPLVVFPMIFQFIKKDYIDVPENLVKVVDFFLQNLIYTSLLRAKHHYKIELTFREINNYQKNEKFRRDIHMKNDVGHKPTDFSELLPLGQDMVDLMLKFREFCENEGMNLSAIFDRYHEMRTKEEETLALTLKFCIEGLKNFIEGEGPIFERLVKMSKRKLDDGTAFFHYDVSNPPTIDNNIEVYESSCEDLRAYLWNKRKIPGMLDTNTSLKGEEGIAKVAENLLDFYESPEEKKKRSYRYFSQERSEWNAEDYERFYKAVEKYNAEPLANKKIAKYMGKHIDPNHVRYERQQYNKKLKLMTSNPESPAESLKN